MPTHGSTVLVSGYIDGKSAGELRVEVETMQFITPTRGGEGIGSPRTPGRSKFGIPMGFVHTITMTPSFTNYVS